MKTIKQWLEELPEPYRTQALENADRCDLDKDAKSKPAALRNAFEWEETPEDQGYYYWEDLWEKLL